MKHLFLIGLTTLLLFAKADRSFELTKLGDPTSGHTLLIFGGIHGNEPGGYFAPAVLAQFYKIQKGALWVVPDINQEAITRFWRGMHGDMNRKFAILERSDRDAPTVKKIKKLIKNKDVDLILNLHDGHGYYRKRYKNGTFNPNAWGQSCVIDQTCLEDSNATFADLNDVAEKVSKKLNNGLLQDHHYFNVKNTKTKRHDKAMQLSLTYYAINQGKPAFAIETSKNLTKTSEKVFYQLRAIEAFMDIMDIKFTRSFEFSKKGVEEILKDLGTLKVNNAFELNLSDIRPILYFMPLKQIRNYFEFSHPLANIIWKKDHYEIYIGHKRISSFYKDAFPVSTNLKEVQIMLNDEVSTVKLASTVDVNGTFAIKLPKEYRVNIIGFKDPKYNNENGVAVSLDKMQSRYAIDTKRRKYRVEVYKDGVFYGMMIINFKS
ncbi:MAG: succinylglutamate desuccinylase/aspartoacylase family protein [Thiovulaceae bacterium]|nr:succinylglutamate desuccinylase/aspartoacylase family protein [Sulfurimonadaceae bacterium]